MDRGADFWICPGIITSFNSERERERRGGEGRKERRGEGSEGEEQGGAGRMCSDLRQTLEIMSKTG